MGNPKPVFVMVTAATCGHCQKLHKRWTPIRKALRDLGSVRIKELNLDTMGSKVADKGYPADMQRYIGWFPTALLFPGDNWDEVMKGKSSKLKGRIMNGKIGNPMPTGSEYSIDEKGLVKWINSVLADPTFSSSFDDDDSKHIIDDGSSASPSTPSKRYIPTSRSAELCRKMNIKTRR